MIPEALKLLGNSLSEYPENSLSRMTQPRPAVRDIALKTHKNLSILIVIPLRRVTDYQHNARLLTPKQEVRQSHRD